MWKTIFNVLLSKRLIFIKKNIYFLSHFFYVSIKEVYFHLNIYTIFAFFCFTEKIFYVLISKELILIKKKYYCRIFFKDILKFTFFFKKKEKFFMDYHPKSLYSFKKYISLSTRDKIKNVILG